MEQDITQLKKRFSELSRRADDRGYAIYSDFLTLAEQSVLLSELPYTILFVDGNHENFDRLLSEFPIEDWNGGKVHKIRPNIIHLMRGHVFEIEGKRIFAMGGGYSVDKYMRRE